MTLPAHGRPIEPLTRKEKQVLALMLEGHYAKQIAARLGNCDRTIEIHVAHIRRKYRASRIIDVVIAVLRTEALAAYERGFRDGRGRQLS